MVASALPLAIASTIATVGGQAAQTIGQVRTMKAQAKQEKINARIADTRAMQVDAERRQELDRSIGAIRASRAGDLGNLSPTALAFLDEANTNISTTRLREVANEKQRAADFRSSARALKQSARVSLITGGFKTALSMFQGAGNIQTAAKGP